LLRLKILIVEDEDDLLTLLVNHLKKESHVCEQATTWRGGYQKINNFDYDCVLIDLDLPDGDGLKLVQLLRADASNTAIVVISARATIADRIHGLNLGADDFLTKPFSLAELSARINAILRRRNNIPANELNFGKLVIQLDERQASSEERAIKLTKKEFDILVYLARNRNRVVTKGRIAEHLWGDYMDEAVSYDFIYAHVKNLRKKLLEYGCGDYLQTVYGIGYKFQV